MLLSAFTYATGNDSPVSTPLPPTLLQYGFSLSRPHGHYQSVLTFPRHAGNYDDDVAFV